MQDQVLFAKARAFADDISGLLNNTVCAGVRVSATLAKEQVDGGEYLPIAKVANGSGIDPEPIGLTLGRKAPSGYLALAYSLRPDREDRHLMVVRSFVGLYTDFDNDEILCHFDYEREKQKYPEAHIQVCADSAVWRDWLDKRSENPRPLAKAHFPVGGRRNRTSLEDVVEFLIVERLADPHANAEAAIAATRAVFHERQLRAAIRRAPGVAIDELRQNGHIE